MKHVLVEMMSQITSLTQDEEHSIIESFPIKTYPAGSILLKEGQIANKSFFVLSGCIREYSLIDGEEKTLEFYTEEQAVANFNSMVNKSPSHSSLECIEETTVSILEEEKEKALYKKHPRFESFCRSGVEQMMGQKQAQLARMIVMKPEDRYKKMVEERAELLQRVPQYQLASYLGIKPETLSRIRKRLAQK